MQERDEPAGSEEAAVTAAAGIAVVVGEPGNVPEDVSEDGAADAPAGADGVAEVGDAVAGVAGDLEVQRAVIAVAVVAAAAAAAAEPVGPAACSWRDAGPLGAEEAGAEEHHKQSGPVGETFRPHSGSWGRER